MSKIRNLDGFKLPLLPTGEIDKRTKQYKAWKEFNGLKVERAPEPTIGGAGRLGTYAPIDFDKPASVLLEADKLINGSREKEYGPPKENLANIALLWDAYLRGKYGISFTGEPYSITAVDVCNMMAMLKIARGYKGYHADSTTDACGYIGLIQRVQS